VNAAATITSIIVGGIVILTGAIALARAIFRQASSTDNNAAAIGSLTKAVNDLGVKIEGLDRRVDQHEVDIAVLRDRRDQRRWGGAG
jgi:hypothetical protein